MAQMMAVVVMAPVLLPRIAMPAVVTPPAFVPASGMPVMVLAAARPDVMMLILFPAPMVVPVGIMMARGDDMDGVGDVDVEEYRPSPAQVDAAAEMQGARPDIEAADANPVACAHGRSNSRVAAAMEPLLLPIGSEFPAMAARKKTLSLTCPMEAIPL